MRVFLYLLVLSVHLFAYDALDLKNVKSAESALKNLYCTADANKSLSFDLLLNNTQLKPIQESNLGYSTSVYWCRLELINTSPNEKEFVFYNPRPGMDFVDVNIYEKNKTRTLRMGDMQALKNRDLNSIFSNIFLSLESGERVVLISRYESIGALEINWEIKDLNSFLSYQTNSLSFMYLYLGFLLAVFFYKMISYNYIRDKVYLIYGIFVFSIIVSNLSVVGILHYHLAEYIDYYTITLLGFLFIPIILFSLWLFTFNFF
ncbi:MAG: 7TM-DISM domain-containing protein [Sulfurimonas sp.]|nr:7TM-DISM domain-containing protein [Sulfurimonas sp.]